MLYSDVDSSTFPRILKELLGKKNFSLKKEFEGQPLVAPPWGRCLSYEYELRREAYKRCREQSVGFNAAWWGTCADTKHRMLHWLQLVSLANSVPQVPPQTIASVVQKEVAAQLKRSSTDRSRTPRLNKGGGKGRPQLPAPQQLALTGPAASSSVSTPAPKRNAKSNKKTKGQRPPASKVWTMRDLHRGGPEVQKMLHGNRGNGICFSFQDGRCENSSCVRQHVCIASFAAGQQSVAAASPTRHLVMSCEIRVLLVTAHVCHETDFLAAHRDALHQHGSLSLRTSISVASEIFSRSYSFSVKSNPEFFQQCTWHRLRALGRGSVTAAQQDSPRSEQEDHPQASAISLRSYSSKSKSRTDKSKQ